MGSDLKEKVSYFTVFRNRETAALQGKVVALPVQREFWQFSVLNCIHSDVLILILGFYSLPISVLTFL